MAKYRKKTVEIEAFKFGIDDMPEWFTERIGKTIGVLTDGLSGETVCTKEISGSILMARKGDYIIKEASGMIHICVHGVFEDVYELINNFNE